MTKCPACNADAPTMKGEQRWFADEWGVQHEGHPYRYIVCQKCNTVTQSGHWARESDSAAEERRRKIEDSKEM